MGRERKAGRIKGEKEMGLVRYMIPIVLFAVVPLLVVAAILVAIGWWVLGMVFAGWAAYRAAKGIDRYLWEVR